MFIRQLRVVIVRANGDELPCPLKGIDSFAMRNFTNDAVFDDTLPVADGLMEAGLRVPLDLLEKRMDDWLRRKNYMVESDHLRVTQIEQKSTEPPARGSV